jgi:hypothetical protein
MTTSFAKLRAWVLVPVLVVGAGTLLGACGSGATANSEANIVKSACQKVGAALSDGPDPTADPVGYAEAQILPLEKIKVSDRKLQKAIDSLDSAYKDYFRASGAQGSSALVKRALNSVATFCPGVGQ